MTRQEIRSVQKNDSISSTEERTLAARPGQAQVPPAAPESLENKPKHSDEQRVSSPSSKERQDQLSVEEEANTDADETTRVPLPSYGTLFHEGATFGQSRGSRTAEEKSALSGSRGATAEPQQDSERG